MSNYTGANYLLQRASLDFMRELLWWKLVMLKKYFLFKLVVFALWKTYLKSVFLTLTSYRMMLKCFFCKDFSLCRYGNHCRDSRIKYFRIYQYCTFSWTRSEQPKFLFGNFICFIKMCRQNIVLRTFQYA